MPPRGRQPRQLHLRRHPDRPDLRHPGRRRQRHEQQLDQHLHRARRLARRVDRHRPDPRQPRRLRRHHRRRLLHRQLDPLASNPTPTWVNITSNLKTLAYSIFGQGYNPTTDTRIRSRSTRRSPCPRSWPTGDIRSPSTHRPPQGSHPVLYVGAGNSEQRLGRVSVARQRRDMDPLPEHDVRRRRQGR